MKITGTSNEPRISLTASRPELPSASWMSASTRPGVALLDRLHRFRVRAGDTRDTVAKALDDALQVHGDHRLVLDDQHVGRDLGGDLAPCRIDQLVDFGGVHAEYQGRLFTGEAFDGGQQKRLPGQRRDLLELAVERACGSGADSRS